MTPKTLEPKLEVSRLPPIDSRESRSLEIRMELLSAINNGSVQVLQNPSELAPHVGKYAIFHYYNDDHQECVSMGKIVPTESHVRIDFDAQAPEQFGKLAEHAIYPRFAHATHLNTLVTKNPYNGQN